MDEAWERAVEAARGKEEPEAVKSLTLDGALKCTAGRLPASSLLEQFTQLRILSIANVGLASLTEFPSLPHLERLILSDNRISGGLDALVDAGLVSLRDLDLSNNKIQTLEDLAPLAELNLLSLDLYECPVTRTPEYRSKVFASIKSLQYLDKLDAECNERPESDDEEEEDDDEDDVDDGLDVDEDDLPSSRKDGDRRNSITSVDDEDDEDDVAEDDEDVGDSDEEDEDCVQYNGVANHVNQSNDESGSEDEDEVDDDDVEDEDDEDDDGDAIEVHDIEETEEEEEEGGEAEDEDDDDEDDEDGGTEHGASGEIEVHAEDENGECAEDDDNDEEAVDNNVEEDDDDEEEDYLVQSVSHADEEGASDFDQGEDNDSDDDVDDDDQDPGPADPPSAVKRKREKDDNDDDSDEDSENDGRPSKH